MPTIAELSLRFGAPGTMPNSASSREALSTTRPFASFHHLTPGAAQQERALVIGVAFKHRHHKHEAFECRQRNNVGELWPANEVMNGTVDGCRWPRRVRPPGANHSNGIQNNRPSRP